MKNFKGVKCDTISLIHCMIFKFFCTFSKISVIIIFLGRNRPSLGPQHLLTEKKYGPKNICTKMRSILFAVVYRLKTLSKNVHSAKYTYKRAASGRSWGTRSVDWYVYLKPSGIKKLMLLDWKLGHFPSPN